MTYALAFGILLIAFLAMAYLDWDQRREFAKEREEWRDERRELVTRILRPELVPVKRITQPTDQAAQERLRQRRQDYASVGRVMPARAPDVGADD